MKVKRPSIRRIRNGHFHPKTILAGVQARVIVSSVRVHQPKRFRISAIGLAPSPPPRNASKPIFPKGARQSPKTTGLIQRPRHGAGEVLLGCAAAAIG